MDGVDGIRQYLKGCQNPVDHRPAAPSGPARRPSTVAAAPSGIERCPKRARVYSHLRFLEDGIMAWNDGKSFSDADVESIAGLFVTSKDQSAIGYFGIGFKVVLSITDRPCILSDTHRFWLEHGLDPYPVDTGDTIPQEVWQKHEALKPRGAVFWLPWRDKINVTSFYRQLAGQTGYSWYPLSLDLSRRLLEIAPTDPAHTVPWLLREQVAAFPSTILLVDRIELLFASSLRLDPLRLLQELSRIRPLVVAWPGNYQDGHLTCAERDHPEFRRYLRPDVPLFFPGGKTDALR